MVAQPIVIVGAGGFGREVLAIIRDINEAAEAGGSDAVYDFLGFIDDGEPNMERIHRLGVVHKGGMNFINALPQGCQYVIGIGSGEVRKQLSVRCDSAGLQAATLVAPTAYIGPDVRLSPGAVVCAHASLTTNIEVGQHVHINLNSTVGHDAVLEAFSTVNPLSAVSGDVTVGECSMIGTNSAVNQGIRIGRGSLVASGSAVIKDVADKTLVAGVPAVPKKQLD